MKKVIPIILVGFALLALILSFSRLESKPAQNEPQEKQEMMFPEEISQMLQNSCNDCHISESSNLKAKGKLNFSKWDDMSDSKKVGKLESIAEEVRDDKMPPSRYLDKNPGAALTKEQKEAIIKWTSDEINKLMGEE
jgi:hypothetical protein